MRHLPRTLFVLLAILFANAVAPVSQAEDWPTYRHDNTRQGSTSETLVLPLKQAWDYQSTIAPKTAFSGPDNRNFEGKLLRHRVDYDDTFQVAIAGDRLFFGSSVDHHLHCYDLKTGKPHWTFATGGPIRLAPTVSQGRVFFGSDDGFAYAVDALTGRLAWKLRAGPAEEWLLARGDMISRWPVRTGLTILDGIAYFGAGIFPHEDVYLYAVNAETGKVVWKQDNISEADAGRDDLSPQGYLLANKDSLYVPSGRSLPAMLNRNTGKRRVKPTVSWRRDGIVGGTRAVLADGQLFSGGEHVYLALSEETGRSGFGWIDGHQVVMGGSEAYVATGTHILKVDRTKYLPASRERMKLENQVQDLAKKIRTPSKEIGKLRTQYAEMLKKLTALEEVGVLWKTPTTSEAELALCGNVLIAGGEDRVDAFDRTDGKRVWTSKVEGEARGLAVAQGCLVVSTTKGHVHIFADAAQGIVNAEPKTPADIDSSAESQELAKEILETAKIREGFCLIAGAESGELAKALAFNSDLKIYGIEPDPAKVEAARKQLMAAGLYGSRVTIHQADLSAIPYSNYFANLIVSETLLKTGTLSGNPALIARHLKPCGGKIVLGSKGDGATEKAWLSKTNLLDHAEITTTDKHAVMTRGKLPGAGEWTHLYANAGNIAATEDQRIKGGLGVLWYGDPGPGKMVNRHDGAVGPIAVNGRLIIQGDDNVMAYDAYNGHFLWERANPKAFRTGVFQNQNPGNLVGSDEFVFVLIRDVVEQLDAATGKVIAEHKLPPEHQKDREWGYIALQDGKLFGTATVRKELELRMRRRGRRFEDATDVLFAIDVKTGKHLWAYQGKSIVHHTVALGSNRAYFIDSTLTTEQRQAQLAEDKSELAQLTGQEAKLAEARMKRQDARLAVALDANTGKKLWETPVDVTDCSEIGIGGGKLTMLFHNNTLLLGGANANGHYWQQFIKGDFSRRRLVCLSAEDGHKLWAKDANYRHRPIIIEDQIIAEPWSFDLYTGAIKTRPHPLTGEEVPWSIMRTGHHCGMLTGCPSMLMFRSGYTGFYDLDNDDGTRHFAGHRLGCWINAIPANGLVMIPEASAGCVCQFSIASTITLEPREARRPWTIYSSIGSNTPVQHMKLNLAAPGDRKDARDNVWISYPRPRPYKATGLEVNINIKPEFFPGGGYENPGEKSTTVAGAETPWLYTSYANGLKKCTLPLLGTSDAPATYTVRLHFADPANTGEKTFGIKLQDKTVAEKITATNKAAVQEFKNIQVEDGLTIELVPAQEKPTPEQLPILNAVEVLRTSEKTKE